MASLAPTFGVPRVQLSSSVPDTTLDDLNAFVDLDISALAWTKIRKNSPKKKLAGTYFVKIVEMGYDEDNNGFTFGKSTPTVAGQLIGSGEGLLCRIDNGDFDTNMGDCAFIGIFIAKGAGDYRLANLGYMDPDNDFSYMVTGEPLLDALSMTATELDGNTPLDYAGNRTPVAIEYSKRFRTVGGVKINHRMESTKVDQDDACAYDVPVARSADLEFAVLSNNLEDLAQLSAGDYVKYTDSNTDIVELGDSEIQAILSQLKGNKAVKVIYPPNKKGSQVTKVFAGATDVSNAEWVENYQKLEQFRLDQKLIGAPVDDCLGSIGGGVAYVRQAA